jgi:hypothetical protein
MKSTSQRMVDLVLMTLSGCLSLIFSFIYLLWASGTGLAFDPEHKNTTIFWGILICASIATFTYSVYLHA